MAKLEIVLAIWEKVRIADWIAFSQRTRIRVYHINEFGIATCQPSQIFALVEARVCWVQAYRIQTYTDRM